jgi:hypothetical protein
VLDQIERHSGIQLGVGETVTYLRRVEALIEQLLGDEHWVTVGRPSTAIRG